MEASFLRLVPSPEDNPSFAAFYAAINTAADAAYVDVYNRKLADKKWLPQATPHTQPVCMEVNDLMYATMAAGGYEVDLVEGLGRRAHVFLEFPPEDVIADATYMQFVPKNKRTPDMPKVFVATREQMIEYARAHDVSESN